MLGQMKLTTDSRMLPWKQIPRWLQILRVAMIAVWSIGVASGAAAFLLQNNVLHSPTYGVHNFRNLFKYKGGNFYLTDTLYDTYVPLQTTFVVSLCLGIPLIVLNQMLERRIKDRLLDEQLGSVDERMDREERGPD